MKNKKGITLIALIITIIVMLILVGVTVNVALNGGLFDTAKQAASGMQMAQIREKAEVVKATLIAEAQTDSSIILSKQTYKDRLLQEFQGSTAEGYKVIVENGKYDIIIKNVDLDIEVVEHSYKVNMSSILSLYYETNDIKINEKKYGINMSLKLSKNMMQDEYVALRIKEGEEKNATITIDEKNEVVLKALTGDSETQISSIDEYIVLLLNESETGVTHDNIDDWLADEKLVEILGFNDVTNITKKQLYYYLLYDDVTGEITEEELIESLYARIYESTTNESVYINEYCKTVDNLTLYVMINGGEPYKVKERIRIGDEDHNINYIIAKNGKYEFILKTEDNEEIQREILVINSIEEDNPYILTEEEANGLWTVTNIDSIWQLTKYSGNDTDVTVPIYIGNKEIKAVNGAFKNNNTVKNIMIPEGIQTFGIATFSNCVNLERITISETVTSINAETFKNCIKLREITIPNSVTFIYRYEGLSVYSKVFSGCTNLTTINFAPGSNQIPEGQPWGAPNENLVVTKLTE